jgi:hypothetical protein
MTAFPDVEDLSLDPLSGPQDHPEEVASGLPSNSPYVETLLVSYTKFRVNRPLTLFA